SGAGCPRTTLSLSNTGAARNDLTTSPWFRWPMEIGVGSSSCITRVRTLGARRNVEKSWEIEGIFTEFGSPPGCRQRPGVDQVRTDRKNPVLPLLPPAPEFDRRDCNPLRRAQAAGCAVR